MEARAVLNEAVLRLIKAGTTWKKWMHWIICRELHHMLDPVQIQKANEFVTQLFLHNKEAAVYVVWYIATMSSSLVARKEKRFSFTNSNDQGMRI